MRVKRRERLFNSRRLDKRLLAVFLISFAAVGSLIFLTKAANLSVSLQSFATGLSAPTDIANSGVAGDSRLFVTQKTGQVRIIRSDGTVVATPFLDIDSIVGTTANERGLLGVAFHPSYASNGYFFVTYTNNNGDIELSRFTRSAGNPDLADANSRKLIITVAHPNFTNHNGGGVHFGPDGYLYMTLGDGGSGGDPNGNGQNTNVLLGKMLRLDINTTAAYAIPSSNPFAGGGGRGEIWAYGLRNPWRFSFDRQTGDLFIADVGQNNYEEIDFQPAGAAGGRNYGWRCYEGVQPYNTSGCGAQSSYSSPITTYDHTSSRCSVTGGYVYRGSLYPTMRGYYIYADYCSGHLYTIQQVGGNGWNQELQGQFSASISSFGEDINGELYAADLGSGTIFRVRTPTGSTDTTAPTVSLTAPTAGASVTGTVAISATATDNVGVSKVDFMVDGNLVNTDTASPYTYNWNSATVANGSHTITAVATDAANNSRTSTVITVTSTNGSTLPAPWQSSDIGTVGLAGSAAYSSGTFNVQASGANIYGTSDNFRYVYQPLNGDGQITARVASLENTDPFAKAGVMIRESLLAGSANVNLVTTPSNGTLLYYRSTNGGTQTVPTTPAPTSPMWMRLQRTGDSIIASTSVDGITWNDIATQSIPMTTSVYIGLALTAHSNTVLNHASFDNVVVGAGVPASNISTPGHSETISGNYAVTADASDDVGVTKMEFYIDNTLVATDTSVPYGFNWNTTTYANGSHTLSALAYDAAGNIGVHTHITTIQNTAGGGGKIGDFNNDSVVNVLDLSILLSNYGLSGNATKGDANGDGTINITDLSLVLSNYGS